MLRHHITVNIAEIETTVTGVHGNSKRPARPRHLWCSALALLTSRAVGDHMLSVLTQRLATLAVFNPWHLQVVVKVNNSEKPPLLLALGSVHLTPTPRLPVQMDIGQELVATVDIRQTQPFMDCPTAAGHFTMDLSPSCMARFQERLAQETAPVQQMDREMSMLLGL